MICTECGARSGAEAEWCGQCLRRFDAPRPAETTTVTGRYVPATTVYQPVTYSRWRKGPNSFGPLGRISWTVGVVAIAGLCVFSQDLFAIGGWCLIGAPLILRHVWAKARIA